MRVLYDMYSWLSRCSEAKGSSTGLFLIGPTKVNTRIFFNVGISSWPLFIHYTLNMFIQ